MENPSPPLYKRQLSCVYYSEDAHKVRCASEKEKIPVAG